MKRPSKAEIKAKIAKLKEAQPGEAELPEPKVQLPEKKSSQRIRKQGI